MPSSTRSTRYNGTLPELNQSSKKRDLIENKDVQNTSRKEAEGETPHEDDICPICNLLFYRPVTTQCGHTLCESCMLHWADVSATTQMRVMHLDDEIINMDDSVVEAKCPMCRTPSSASLNANLHSSLVTRYPRLYAQRETEEQYFVTEVPTESMTVYIGNTHRRHHSEDQSPNIHEWNFFVRPSHAHIIEEVQIYLHPTFHPSRVIRSLPPYEVNRLGWGEFTVTAHIILKAGYSWVSDDAVGSPDGSDKGMLPLSWHLVFQGRGMMGRWRLKVKKEGGREVEARELERERARFRRAYERDTAWEPPT